MVTWYDGSKSCFVPELNGVVNDKPLCWVRTKDGEIDWSEDCLSPTYEFEEYRREDGYDMIPLYAKSVPSQGRESPVPFLDYEAMCKGYDDWKARRPAGADDASFSAFTAGARWARVVLVEGRESEAKP